MAGNWSGFQRDYAFRGFHRDSVVGIVVYEPPRGGPTGERKTVPMIVGPVEYAVLSYDNGGLGADVTTELAKLVDAGMIRILDLALISKDDDGNVDLADYDETSGLADFATVDGEIGGLISEEDADYAGEVLEPGMSAALLVWEDPWARPLFDALRASGVVLLEGGRVPDDIAGAAMAALSAS